MFFSTRLGSETSRYFFAVLRLRPIFLATLHWLSPSTNTWCLITCTCSTFSILPPRLSDISAHQTYLANLASGGFPSRRRAAHYSSVVLLMVWLTAFVSETTMALVEGRRSLGPSGLIRGIPDEAICERVRSTVLSTETRSSS